jgi:hypothetical protein
MKKPYNPYDGVVIFVLAAFVAVCMVFIVWFAHFYGVEYFANR